MQEQYMLWPFCLSIHTKTSEHTYF